MAVVFVNCGDVKPSYCVFDKDRRLKSPSLGLAQFLKFYHQTTIALNNAVFWPVSLPNPPRVFLKCVHLIFSSDQPGLLAICPSWGLSQKLPRIVGPNRAREVSLTAMAIAEQAESCYVSLIQYSLLRLLLLVSELGFALEHATGLSLNGDVDVHSIFVVSLPTSHPNLAPQKLLDKSSKWKAPPLPDGPVELFVGILSAGNHFAEQMAVRKSWMQHTLIKSSNVVARFLVALNGRKAVNLELKKEAEFFGDIVIVPYLDNYDLVLKTVAISEYGVHTVSAKYIMKCDDDTFVRVDAVIKEVEKIADDKSFYVGNINYYHKPLRYALAEAGIILSKLSGKNSSSDLDDSQGHEGVYFFPERFLSRQDLIDWKVQLEYETVPGIEEKVEED
ncbi:hypothetical protein RHMOL_Rhmol09G0038800 [Rhododendron molle]|uniref:Uncharacterized protein n=1 Tax=Rhododendron molle TaxID=49168 RepID=A0ACC0MAU9_RHOML|nr:hypothetical protein RHMOL_Rhmol09G0038800 [Rhododendron molle]